LLTSETAAAGARLDLVQRAKSEVNTSVFIFANDKAGRVKMAQLRAVAKTGKKVRLLLDAAGNRLPKEALKALLDAGVEVGIYNPLRIRTLFKPHSYSWRMHDKLLIVDGHELVTGGRNIEDGYFGMKRKGVFEFADTDIHVSGLPAKAANEYFMKLWKSKNVQQLDASSYQADPRRLRRMNRVLDGVEHRTKRGRLKRLARTWRQQPTADLQSIRFVNDGARGPRKDRSRTRATVIRMIEKAKTEVEIQNPYVLPDRKLLRAIRQATARGVTVRVITNSKANSDNGLVYRAYESRLPKLAKAGAEVWEYRGRGVLHAKTVTVDGRKVFIGSHNMDPRSERLNREVGVLAHSRQVAKQLKANGVARRKGADLVAQGGSLTPLKKKACGLLCNWIGRRLFGTAITFAGIYGQL